MKLGWKDTRKQLARWVALCTQLDNEKMSWTGQGGRPIQRPYISLNVAARRGQTSGGVRIRHNPLVLADLVVTAVSTGADTLTIPAHGLSSGDGPVRFTTTNTLPGGVALVTDYWIIRVDVNTIALSTTRDNAIAALLTPPTTPARVNITNVGVGTHTLHSTTDTRRVGQEIKHVVESWPSAILTLQCYGDEALDEDQPLAILARLTVRHRLPSSLALLNEMGWAVATIGAITNLTGSLSTASDTDPRAVVEIVMNLTDGAEEVGTNIVIVEVTDALDGLPTQTFIVPPD